MDILIKRIRDKISSLSVNTKDGRRVKGIYVDCLLMAKEEQKRIEKENNIFTILVDFKCDRIGINKTATLIDELYKTEE